MIDPEAMALIRLGEMGRERDEAREQLRIARDKCHQQRMIRLAGDKVYAEMCREAEEQARLLAMSADREEKLRTDLMLARNLAESAMLEADRLRAQLHKQ